jgi:AcrR family transcriptional regulator
MSLASEAPPLPSINRLPSGRHKLSRDDVTQSQRQRLLLAMLGAVYERGYQPTTVADVVAKAAVSRSSFYSHFADKEACFAAAYGFAMDYVFARTQSAADAVLGSSWRERARVDLTGYLNVLASEPALAVTLHLEVLAAGPVAMERRAQMLGLLATRFARLNQLAHDAQPELPRLPLATFALYTGGLDELIRDRLRTGGARSLRELSAPVLEATFALLGAAADS